MGIVTGVIALMRQKNPEATYDSIWNALLWSANKQQDTTGTQACGGVGVDTYPNNNFGYGRLDALKAVNAHF